MLVIGFFLKKKQDFRVMKDRSSISFRGGCGEAWMHVTWKWGITSVEAKRPRPPTEPPTHYFSGIRNDIFTNKSFSTTAIMGRVRTKTVKKSAKVIIERYYPKLTLDFETNKRICDEIAIIASKRLRNKVRRASEP